MKTFVASKTGFERREHKEAKIDSTKTPRFIEKIITISQSIKTRLINLISNQESLKPDPELQTQTDSKEEVSIKNEPIDQILEKYSPQELLELIRNPSTLSEITKNLSADEVIELYHQFKEIILNILEIKIEEEEVEEEA